MDLLGLLILTPGSGYPPPAPPCRGVRAGASLSARPMNRDLAAILSQDFPRIKKRSRQGDLHLRRSPITIELFAPFGDEIPLTPFKRGTQEPE